MPTLAHGVADVWPVSNGENVGEKWKKRIQRHGALVVSRKKNLVQMRQVVVVYHSKLS
jgi:hypothetical protein